MTKTQLNAFLLRYLVNPRHRVVASSLIGRN